jgi:DNA processing protein
VKPKYSVAMVGARAATNYGTTVAYEIAADLAAEGVVVVSGGAFGIDAAAHRGALAAQGVTIAVLANGIDQVYPVGNTSLLHAVMATGVVMTELPPGMHPTRQGFLARNRLIAALGGATLVVEAAARSGSASTVTRALELGRDVMAVPGPVTSMMSVGTHELIRDGATLVTSADDVRELLNPW